MSKRKLSISKAAYTKIMSRAGKRAHATRSLPGYIRAAKVGKKAIQVFLTKLRASRAA